MAQTQKLPGIIVFRGNTKEVEARKIIDRQFVFDIEKNEFFIDTNKSRVKCGQDASKMEDYIKEIQDKIESGDIVSKDEIDEIIEQVTENKQDKIKNYDDVLYKANWDLFSTDGDNSIHEYYYKNDNIKENSEIHITPAVETLEEYDNVVSAELFPAIDTFTDSSGQRYCLIRAKNIPEHDIKIHVSVI